MDSNHRLHPCQGWSPEGSRSLFSTTYREKPPDFSSTIGTYWNVRGCGVCLNPSTIAVQCGFSKFRVSSNEQRSLVTILIFQIRKEFSKMNHGGSRPGSGRKPSTIKGVTRRLPKDTA